MRYPVLLLAGALTVAQVAQGQEPPEAPVGRALRAPVALAPLGQTIGVAGLGGTRLGWQSPRDSAYQRARELLNRGEYRQAAELFRDYRQKAAEARNAAAAGYWEAFARYRMGTDAELRAADELLVALLQNKAMAGEKEVQSLAFRVAGALAARGDAAAARRLREGSGLETACDREDAEVRAEALSALLHSDQQASLDVLRRVIAKRDECGARLRSRAVQHLGKLNTPEARTLLGDVVLNDPNPEVRGEAIGVLARLPGSAGWPIIAPLFERSTDDKTLRIALAAVARAPEADVSPVLRKLIERADVSEAIRAEAIRCLIRRRDQGIGGQAGVATAGTVRHAQGVGGSSSHRLGEAGLSDGDATFLKGVYERDQAPAVRRAIVEAMQFAAPAARDGWILSLLKAQSADGHTRGALLAALRRSEVAIEEVAKLYDAMSERESRSALVSILAARPEPAATDKLVEIAKSGTDPSIRREAVGALARKNDPRATKMLLELLER